MVNSIILQALTYVIYVSIVALFGVLVKVAVKVAAHLGFKLTEKKALLAVKAAEQVIGSGNGSEKKKLVVSWLNKAFGKKFDQDLIEQLIEAAVMDFNKALDKSLDNIPEIPVPEAGNIVETGTIEGVIDKTEEVIPAQV